MKKFCKHKKYKIIRCNKDEKRYYCQCIKCSEQFELPKAIGEEYMIGKILNRK